MQKLISSLEREGAVKVMKDKSEEMEDIKEKLKESQRGSRDQNIRNRYHGNDELTNKYLNKAEQMDLEPPEDKEITTLYVSLMGMPITEKELVDQFYAYGEIKSIQVVPLSNCAFVTYTTREAAEMAVEKLHGNLVVRGARLKIMWGRPQSKKPGQGEGMGGVPAPPPMQTQEHAPAAGAPAAGFYPYPAPGPPGLPAVPPPPPPGRPPAAVAGAQGAFMGGPGRIIYPSMDPSQMGTVIAP
jgi:pre-mRNA-splicing factor RBM22/SLT11